MQIFIFKDTILIKYVFDIWKFDIKKSRTSNVVALT